MSNLSDFYVENTPVEAGINKGSLWTFIALTWTNRQKDEPQIKGPETKSSSITPKVKSKSFSVWTRRVMVGSIPNSDKIATDLNSNTTTTTGCM